MHNRRIAVIGLGYVGLPVLVAFAKAGADVLGFDINETRVSELQSGHDRTHEVEHSELIHNNISFSSTASDLSGYDFFIVTVPTPIDDAHRPDLGALLAASNTVGSHLKPGSIVVYESTVYPGATEDDCVPVLEKASGLAFGKDFAVGYSPERINPGDRTHRFETIVKVVSGSDPETREIVAQVYGSVVQAGVHIAPSIKVAEAAKVIENTQRDLNIALMNELSQIFHRLNIDTHDVLTAAGTKWNFLRFFPGLVGGHCIGIDPYYLTHRSEREGYHPEVILAGRRINDTVGERIARECIRLLSRRGIAGMRVNVLGLTFKEDVPDLRNSKVVSIIEELRSFGAEVSVADALALPAEAQHEYGIDLVDVSEMQPADAVILAVPHAAYLEQGWDLINRQLLEKGGRVVIDVRGVLDRSSVPTDVQLWRL